MNEKGDESIFSTRSTTTSSIDEINREYELESSIKPKGRPKKGGEGDWTPPDFIAILREGKNRSVPKFNSRLDLRFVTCPFLDITTS